MLLADAEFFNVVGYQNNPAFDSTDSTRMRDRMGRDPIELTEFAAPGTSGPRSVQVSCACCACASCDFGEMCRLLSAVFVIFS